MKAVLMALVMTIRLSSGILPHAEQSGERPPESSGRIDERRWRGKPPAKYQHNNRLGSTAAHTDGPHRTELRFQFGEGSYEPGCLRPPCRRQPQAKLGNASTRRSKSLIRPWSEPCPTRRTRF